MGGPQESYDKRNQTFSVENPGGFTRPPSPTESVWDEDTQRWYPKEYLGVVSLPTGAAEYEGYQNRATGEFSYSKKPEPEAETTLQALVNSAQRLFGGHANEENLHTL